MEKITLTSPAFGSSARIPAVHTGEGQDVSPILAWSGVPAGAKELVLIVDDPDSPTPQPWVHWVLCHLPASVTALPQGVGKQEKLSAFGGAIQGENTFGKIGYNGPLPPKGHGVHHYHFRLYALDQEIRAEATKESLLAAMEGHVLGVGELVGVYDRK